MDKNAMTNEREQEILERYVERKGVEGVEHAAMTAACALIANLLNKSDLCELALAEMRLTLDALSIAWDRDTAEEEIAVLRVMEMEAENDDAE